MHPLTNGDYKGGLEVWGKALEVSRLALEVWKN
jgi:hypothetical protein